MSQACFSPFLAGFCALVSLQDAQRAGVSVEMSQSFLAPAKGGEAWCDAVDELLDRKDRG